MITISNLTNKSNGRAYSFSDINLNFEEQKKSSSRSSSNVVAGNDLVVDWDEAAIRNSIRNLLTQKRHLSPNFNINLKKHIGHPVTNFRAEQIGAEIERGIGLFEPRVKLERVIVATDFDLGSYYITILVKTPNFGNRPVMIASTFNSSGDFAVLNN